MKTIISGLGFWERGVSDFGCRDQVGFSQTVGLGHRPRRDRTDVAKDPPAQRASRHFLLSWPK